MRIWRFRALAWAGAAVCAACVAAALLRGADVAPAAAAPPEPAAHAAQAAGAEKQPLAPQPPADEIARILAYKLPRLHLARMPMDDIIAARARRLYIDSLDYEHCFFLASDIAGFEADDTQLDDWLQAGDVTFAYRVFQVFKERVANRVQYVNRLLDDGFDYDRDEVYRWKRKDEPWPRDEAEWNDIWRRKIMNEHVRRLVSDVLTEPVEIKDAATNAPVAAKKKDGAGDRPPKAAAAERPPDADADEEAEVDANASPEEFVRKRYRQFLTVLQDNESDWVLQRYLSAFARAYDPHTDYMSASETEDFDISMKLSLVGIGALLTPDEGAAKIVRIIPGGPADKDGRLKPNDKIIAVAQGDGRAVSILHWPLARAVRIIRGEKGTKVVLHVIPASAVSGMETVKIDLTRDEVKLEDQAAKCEVKEFTGPGGAKRKLGVISLPAFYADLKGRSAGSTEVRSSTRDVKKGIEDMKKQGIEGAILDLRNNGGGSLLEAVDMSGLFITTGPIVQVKELRGVSILPDKDPAVAYDGPLIVLVNRFSASASEILAGALQDYGRAVIVGDSKTHGKGTVQSVVDLDRSKDRLGTMKVTTASFHRITGASMQRKGVACDVVVPSAYDAMEVGEEFLDYALSFSPVAPAIPARTWDDSPEAGILERLMGLTGLGPPQQPVDDSALVATLREASAARRRADPRYAARDSFLALLAQRQQSKEITLNLRRRIELARDEQKLQDLQNRESPEAGASNVNDLVMIETMNLLCAMVPLWPPQKPQEQRPADQITKGAR